MGVTDPAYRGDGTAGVLQVFCTIDSEIRARDVAEALVEERLSACVQVLGPLHSTYRWKGSVEAATEWLLLIKATEEAFDAVRTRLVEMHPYDMPEIIAVPIVGGLEPYMDWIASSTG
jgi:periplasmic divalent cation tolerance protein